MRENKRIKLYTLIALIMSILTISVAYAVLSTSLEISGTTNIQASDWEFELGKGMSLLGKDYETTGSAIYNEPTFDGVTATYTFSLAKPGDSVTYFFRILNPGTLPGEIESVVNSTPTCKSATNNTNDEGIVCNNLNYEISYTDGTPIQAGDVMSIEETPNTCLKGSTTGTVRSIKVKITFNEDANAVPSSTITVNNLKTTINIKQTDKVCTNDGGIQEPT